MRALLQRVNWANVVTAGSEIGAIETGLLILLGVRKGDTSQEADALAKKICQLRIFEDEKGKMNWDLKTVKGSALVVSQFTLYAETQKGRRPDFLEAEAPQKAKEIYEFFCQALKGEGISVETGAFGAHMTVSLQNDGPVTIMLEANPT